MLIILFVLNVPLYFLLGKSMFGGWEEFLESIVATMTFSGEYGDGRISKFTLYLFVIICVGTVAAEYHVVAKYLFGMERPWG